MQVFMLDTDFEKNASYYVDKHVVKIPTEIAQILSTCLYLRGYEKTDIYKPTHIFHPWIKWTCESWSNFSYLVTFGHVLCEEYSLRYQKNHKTLDIIKLCDSIKFELSKLDFSSHEFDLKKHTDFPLCMPEQYHDKNPIIAYRNYYKTEKRHLAGWRSRSVPAWWSQNGEKQTI
jgi:hypothetical protein